MKLKIFLFFLPLLISCDYVLNLKRTGDIITITQELDTVNWNIAPKIEVFAPVRIIPVISNENKIEITGMDFIVNDYELIQSDKKLVIEHKHLDRLQESKIADIILYAPKFESIIVNSPCKFDHKDTLYINKLQIVINGKGINTSGNLILKGNNFNFAAYGLSKCEMNFSGELKSAYYVLQGGAKINTKELLTEKVEIIHKSYVDFYVNVLKSLNVKIYAPGNVYYKGNPEVKCENIENNLFNATGNVSKISD